MKIFKLAVALVLLAAVASCGRPPGAGGARGRPAVPGPTLAQQQSQARTVSIVVLGPHSLEGGLQASGALLPREDTAIFPQINGYRVVRVLTDEGQWVQGGQTLAVLDDTLLRSQVAQQEALVAQQAVQADRARSEAARVNGLDDEGVLSQEAVQGRRFAARAAAAQAAAQRAQLADLRTRLGQLAIRAPYAGLVIERTVRVGDIAAAGSPWFRIARGGEVELAADVAESSLSSLSPGTPATVTLADGTQVQGTVRLVSPRVDATTRLGRVRVTLPVRPDVRSGGFARATFTGASVAALTTPETAVRYDAGGAAVMVVDANNRVTRQPVTTGRRGGGYVELLTGPPAGTKVVSRFASMLVVGDIIRPVLDPTYSAVPAPMTAPGAPMPIAAHPGAPLAVPARPAPARAP